MNIHFSLLRFFLLLFLCGNFFLYAQSIRYWQSEKGYTLSPELFTSLQKTKNFAAAAKTCQEYVEKMQAKGYASANIDTLYSRNDTFFLACFLGKKYRLTRVELDTLPYFLEKENLPQNEPFNWKKLEESSLLLLDKCQENGYPFAAITQKEWREDSTKAGEIQVEILWSLSLGQNYLIDSIQIQGKIRETARFTQSLMRIRKGDLYKQSSLNRIESTLNNSPYYKNTSLQPVRFYADGKALLIVKTESRKSSKFDVLIGILPASSSAADKKVQFVGNIDLAFVSPFRQGEIIQFRYDKLPQSSQKMNLKLGVPYIAGSPLRVDGELDLLRQYPDFLNRQLKAGAEYAFSPYLSAKIGYKSKSTILEDSLARRILNGSRKPDVLDGSQSLYTAGFKYEMLDNRLNPTNGWFSNFSIGSGTKKIRKNPLLPNTLYDTLAMSQPMREVEVEMYRFQKLFPRQVLKVGGRAYWLGLKQYYQSDQMQIGGLKTLRGFNENAFFTDYMLAGTLEYRFILEKNSCLLAFYDYATLGDRVNKQSIHPMGIGFGMNYETNAGILSLTYGVGKVEGQGFQFGRGKIHVGLMSVF